MRKNTTILADLLSPLSRSGFQRHVNEYKGDFHTSRFSTYDLLKLGVYGHISGMDTSRGIKSFLNGNATRLYHWGIKNVSLSNFCGALEKRDSRIFEQTFEDLVEQAGFLSAGKGLRFKNPVKAVDSTTIEVSLKRYSWADFRKTKGAIKLHTRFNTDMQYPEKIICTDGKVHDVRKMDYLCSDADTIYTGDRGYIDYNSLHNIELHDSTFVIRMKSGCQYETLCVFEKSDTGPVRLDADIILTGQKSQKSYPRVLRMVEYHDSEYDRDYTFLTNNFELASREIADVYKTRWQIELFFKWIKQNLKIKSFWGTSRNAVMVQIWIALIVAILLWIHKTMQKLEMSAHSLLSILKTVLLVNGTLKALLKKLAEPPPLVPDLQLTLWSLS